MSDQINPSASLVSLATTAENEMPATPSASTTALMPKTPSRTPTASPPAKNYEQAFAALSSSYGFAGTVPTKNPKKDKKSKKRADKAQSPKGEASGSAQGGASAGGGQSAPAK
ncbi:uncharacterized protein TRAVEDRAFT_24641 [Trametes versicolor FP-101664 SS1]|uniref:uncharacterized protein n=1 Tax=Trametes versicolor (strain FP-101664) TaxID=717944 RepID=UPI000462215B|nr:uncharacterized protein TRAVEDRAFT_24641 [Trametes versicolor FP-101664 SS1]EIW52448.1 hypothetical protein TRAVEDRAFT_24641 [Trametes versicolor FP-101664 SS1]